MVFMNCYNKVLNDAMCEIDDYKAGLLTLMQWFIFFVFNINIFELFYYKSNRIWWKAFYKIYL